jgi:taurine dioxygenase
MTLRTRKLAAQIGTEILLDTPLSQVDDATFREIQAAWRADGVLVFRGQPMTHAEHVRFSARFGPLDDHRTLPRVRDPEVHEILPVTNQVVAGRRLPVGRQWHSDMSYTLTPPRGSLLRCEVIPPVGGDTMFANMTAAYDTLSATMKSVVDDLWAVHDLTLARHNQGRPDIDEVRRNTPPTAQPVVRVHAETGRKALYVSEMVTSRIVGMSEEESRAILDYLFRHSVRPEFTYRHRWRPGDLIAWDNRCAMHLALDDYDLEVPRKLYRTTLLGDPLGHPVDPATGIVAALQ